MRILPLIILLVCVAWQATAQEEGEARPVPGRGLLKRGSLTNGKSKGSTTTTTPAPQEEEEYEDEGEEEGEAQEPSTAPPPPSSTEGKKLVGGGVRPFRSNKDLLETLKRRRAQAAEEKLHGHSTTTTGTPLESAAETAAKSSYNKKRVNGAKESGNIETHAAANKSNRGRFSKTARSIQESDAEDQNDAAPVKPNRFPRQRGV